MSKLYEKVSPGGDILVGNYAGRPPEFAWLPTYVYDWPLRYRSRVEMSDLADGLDGVEQVQVLTEATNAQYFTHVSKRKK
jgi:hypothetical protein